MRDFIEEILKEEFKGKFKSIFGHSPLLQYLDSKMGAVYGNSKTRRSLANIYAVYAILNFYVEDFYNQKENYKTFSGYPYTKVYSFAKGLYGGEKLQNHGFNNRVNFEFRNKGNDKDLIIIDNGKYALHIDFLYVDNKDISKTAIRIVKKYIQLLQEKDNAFVKDLEELKNLKTKQDKLRKIHSMLTEKSEARVFEIISYAVLKNHYKETKIYWGYTKEFLRNKFGKDINEVFLQLYKTGRTNANDGGIDFVMRPLGRFFQVTEVMDNYDKYLLDIDKVMHFPITFVVRTIKTKDDIKSELEKYIQKKSGGMEILVNRYNDAIEEIITINELKNWIKGLSDDEINSVISDIEIYYRLEMNLL